MQGEIKRDTFYRDPTVCYLFLRHSGNTLPDKFVSSANVVGLRFTTDESVSATGFRLTYSKLTLYCPAFGDYQFE